MTKTAMDPRQWRLRLVGYGEVGRILAEDLRAAGASDLATWDLKFETADGDALKTQARDHGVRVTASLAALVADADLVISAVTASQTLAVAAQCAPSLAARAFVLDLNSASPSAKQQAGALIDGAGGRYVEAAVMTSIPPYRIRVPMLLGGPHASELAPALTALGFAVTVTSDRLGVASATKMCRSVMIKGLEALTVESLSSARAYGVEDAVLASLAETFPQIDWEAQASYFFHRAIQHGRRRGEEMREVAVTVADTGLAPLAAEAIAGRMEGLAELVEGGQLTRPAGSKPADWRLAADRLLASGKSAAAPPKQR